MSDSCPDPVPDTCAGTPSPTKTVDVSRRAPGRVRGGEFFRIASAEAVQVWREPTFGGADRCRTVEDRQRRAKDPFLRAAAFAAEAGLRGTPLEAALLRRLRSWRSDDRWAAAILLGVVGSEDVAAPLCALLRDRVPKVQCGAAFALGDLGSPEAIEPLLRLLKRCVGRRTLHWRYGAYYGGAAVVFSWWLTHEWLIAFLGETCAMVFYGIAIVALIAGMIGTAGIQRANMVLPAVCRALAKLADTDHIPQVVEASAELRAVAETKYYTPANRNVAKQLADSFDGTLANMAPLPIPAGPAAVQMAQLPRPSSAGLRDETND